MTSNRITAVAFDVGGVLLCDIWEHLYFDEPDGIAARFGLTKEKLLPIGERLWEDFAYRTVDASAVNGMEVAYWEKFREECKHAFPDSTLPAAAELIEASKTFIRPLSYKTMRDTLEELAGRGVTLAICSNNNDFWFKRQMELAGYDRFFPMEHVVLSSHVGVPKSDPSGAMFKELLRRVRVPASSVLFFDDRKPNVSRATEYGIHASLVPSGEPDGVDEMIRALMRYGLLA